MTSGHLIIGVEALLFLGCGGMLLSLEFHLGGLFSELRSYRYVVVGIIAPMDSQPFSIVMEARPGWRLLRNTF